MAVLKVIPSILSNSPEEAKELLVKAEGVVDRVQIDIVDGVFANNKTIDPSALEDVETSLNLDFHLMVKEPVNWVEKCLRAGADRIIGQVEMMASQVEFLKKVQEVGVLAGLALDLETPISALDTTIVADMDVILIMSVQAGFGGQEFKRKALGKILELKKLKTSRQARFNICVDGGETLEVVDESHFLGADEIVVGRKLFAGDVAENVKKIEQAAHDVNFS